MIKIAVQEDGSLVYCPVPNLPAPSGRRSSLRIARTLIRAWRPIQPADFLDEEGQRRIILRLTYLLTHVFEVRKSGFGEEVWAGESRVAEASFSLFGRGYHDVRLYGLGCEASWSNVGRQPPYASRVRGFTETTLGILGAVAKARASIREGRHRSRVAALAFYHVTTRSLSFVDRALARLPAWALWPEREVHLIFYYLRQIYRIPIAIIPSEVSQYANENVRELLARHPGLGPVKWSRSLPPEGPVVAIGPRRWWEKPRKGCYEIIW